MNGWLPSKTGWHSILTAGQRVIAVIAWPSDPCREELDGAAAAGEAGSLAGDLGPGTRVNLAR